MAAKKRAAKRDTTKYIVMCSADNDRNSIETGLASAKQAARDIATDCREMYGESHDIYIAKVVLIAKTPAAPAMEFKEV